MRAYDFIIPNILLIISIDVERGGRIFHESNHARNQRFAR